jgi:hypothetical protein
MDKKEIRTKCIELALRYVEIVAKNPNVKPQEKDLCLLEIAADFENYIENGR